MRSRGAIGAEVAVGQLGQRGSAPHSGVVVNPFTKQNVGWLPTALGPVADDALERRVAQEVGNSLACEGDASGGQVVNDLGSDKRAVMREQLSERLQMALEAVAKRILIPSENKRDLADVPDEVLSKLQPIFYTDPINAAIRAMGLQ